MKLLLQTGKCQNTKGRNNYEAEVHARARVINRTSFAVSKQIFLTTAGNTATFYENRHASNQLSRIKPLTVLFIT